MIFFLQFADLSLPSPRPGGNIGQCGTYWLQLLCVALFLVFNNRQHCYGLDLPLIHKEL